MAHYIIHDGEKVLNRIVADEPIKVKAGQTCVEAVGNWNGAIGQSVDENGVIPFEVSETALEDLKNEKIILVKAKAKLRIESIIKPEIQLRTLARGIKLVKKISEGTATVDEISEAQAIEDMDTEQLQPIRDASNEIESEINSKQNVETVKAIDIENHPVWPATV